MWSSQEALYLGNKLADHRGLQLTSFLWNLKQCCIWTGVSEGEAMVIILLQRCEAELNARHWARVWMEGGKLVDPGQGVEGEGWPWPCLCLSSPTVMFFLFHFCKMIKIVYILKGVSRVWSSVRWKPEVAGLLRTGFHPMPVHSHMQYHCFLFR